MYNQPGIHVSQDIVTHLIYPDGVVFVTPVDMAHGFVYDFLQQFGFHVQVDALAFHTGDGQKVFHQIDKPHGIIVYVPVYPATVFGRQVLPIAHQDTCIAGYAGERGAQVMGDGTQQIAPELFRPGHGRFLLPLPGNIFFFQRHGTLGYDGYCQTVFKVAGRRGAHMNSHDAIDSA